MARDLASSTSAEVAASAQLDEQPTQAMRPYSSVETWPSTRDAQADAVCEFVLRRSEQLSCKQAEADAEDIDGDHAVARGHSCDVSTRESTALSIEPATGDSDQLEQGDTSVESWEEDPNQRQLLVEALAKVLMHLAAMGSSRQPVASGFNAVKPPAMGLQDYLARISHYYFCGSSCLVLGLVYIDRLMKLHPEFVVCPKSIHRLTAASMTVAVKFFDDEFYSNAYYSRVAGIRVQELNALEVEFLCLIDWRLHVPCQEFESYRSQLDGVLQALQASEDSASASRPQPCMTLKAETSTAPEAAVASAYAATKPPTAAGKSLARTDKAPSSVSWRASAGRPRISSRVFEDSN
jgi:hypothetical protein